MVGRAILFLALAGLAVAVPRALSQPFDAEAGRPQVRNFSPLDYNAHQINFAAVQDSQGVMYFANGDGLLEYDGVSWRFLSFQAEARVYDLAVDAGGTVYEGAEDDLG